MFLNKFMTKTAHFHSNLLVSWELVTEVCQFRPAKCVHFKGPSPDKYDNFLGRLFFSTFSLCNNNPTRLTQTLKEIEKISKETEILLH